MSGAPDRLQDPRSVRATLRWARSPAAAAGAATGLLLAAIGLIAGRADVALLALPLIAAAALSADRRPGPGAESVATLSVTADGGGEAAYSLTLDLPASVELIVLRQRLLGGEPRELVLAAPLGGELAGTVPLLHSGPQEIVRFDYRLLSAGGAVVSIPDRPDVGDLVVAPDRIRIGSLPLPRRLQAMTGPHQSARAGDGGEFRDIHPFVAGDRLRRIDWRVTARLGRGEGDLYVRRTGALADATVLIVMDSRDDIGEQVAQWSRNVAVEKGVSSLDIAREAASSLAASYIAAGDRVGFQDLSSRARMIPQGGGTRHLWRLERAIEVTSPSQVPFRHRRAPIVPAGALVYLLSSLLDDQPANLALSWCAKGHRVIAVDVLPPPRFALTNRYERAAHRLMMMARADRIRVLRRRGVELLTWAPDGGALPLHARLELLSRPVRRLSSQAVRR